MEFVKENGTRSAIFIIRMVMDGAIKMQKEIELCFIDYPEEFDKFLRNTDDRMTVVAGTEQYLFKAHMYPTFK